MGVYGWEADRTEEGNISSILMLVRSSGTDKQIHSLPMVLFNPFS